MVIYWTGRVVVVGGMRFLMILTVDQWEEIADQWEQHVIRAVGYASQGIIIHE